MKKREDENIGKTIRVLRIAAGMKQKVLASVVGIRPNSLSLIEAGKREPSLGLIRSISKALDVPTGLLFWETKDFSRKRNAKESTLLSNLRQQLLELEGLRLAERVSTYKRKNESR